MVSVLDLGWNGPGLSSTGNHFFMFSFLVSLSIHECISLSALMADSYFQLETTVSQLLRGVIRKSRFYNMICNTEKCIV